MAQTSQHVISHAVPVPSRIRGSAQRRVVKLVAAAYAHIVPKKLMITVDVAGVARVAGVSGAALMLLVPLSRCAECRVYRNCTVVP